MKRNYNRILSLLLMLTLVLGLLSGITVPAEAATVDYVYSGQYIYNWGQREQDATFLSPNAEKFYADNKITYDALSDLSGSSTLNSVSSSALYKALQKLMKDNHSHITNYGETRYLYMYTDCENSAKTSKKISSFYSGTPVGPGWDGGSTWNREHTWPNSKGSGDGENDIMMLRPTSVSENSSRGNKAYGEGGSFYDPNRESGGKYNLHGDVARIMLYVYVRWGNTSNMWGASGVMESLDVLLKWMVEDPVDTWELGRNDSVESITGTRNVFVDYPELAFLLFNKEVPTDMTTPSGEAANADSTCKHTNTTNDAGKAASCTENGYTAGVYCKDCKTYISGHSTIPASHSYNDTVTPPTATEDGFTTHVCSVCGYTVTDTVVPALGNTYNVTFFVPVGVDPIDSIGCNKTGILLPAAGIPSFDYACTFLGWATTTVSPTTEMPTIYAADATFTATEDTALYALYSYTQEDVVYYTTEFGCRHSETELTGVKDANCNESGYTGDLVCKECGEIVTSGKETNPVHKLSKIEAKAATTKEEGHIAHSKCDLCGKLFDVVGNELSRDDVVIPKLPIEVSPILVLIIALAVIGLVIVVIVLRKKNSKIS